MTSRELHHYCGNSSFIEILRSREIWATELSLSNDRLEGRWTREVFSRSCEGKASQEDFSRLLQSLDIVIELFGAGGFCLSEEGDLLSQWRGYAENGSGVSIGFASEYLEKLSDFKDREFGVALRQVIYDEAEQEKAVTPFAEEIFGALKKGAFRSLTGTLLTPTSEAEKKEITEAFQRLHFTFLRMFPLLYALKNPAFREEKEWRLISYTPRSEKGYFESDLPHLDFVGKSDRIVPFRRVSLADTGVQPIARVILGPRNITPGNVVKAALEKYGFHGVEVAYSRASYR